MEERTILKNLIDLLAKRITELIKRYKKENVTLQEAGDDQSKLFTLSKEIEELALRIDNKLRTDPATTKQETNELVTLFYAKLFRPSCELSELVNKRMKKFLQNLTRSSELAS